MSEPTQPTDFRSLWEDGWRPYPGVGVCKTCDASAMGDSKFGPELRGQPCGGCGAATYELLNPPSQSTVWRDLRTDPPTGNRCVVLFPLISDVGIPFTASNPEYARQSALQAGYTHWMEIPPLGENLEADAEARCEEFRRLDGLAAVQPLARIVDTPQ